MNYGNKWNYNNCNEIQCNEHIFIQCVEYIHIILNYTLLNLTQYLLMPRTSPVKKHWFRSLILGHLHFNGDVKLKSAWACVGLHIDQSQTNGLNLADDTFDTDVEPPLCYK